MEGLLKNNKVSRYSPNVERKSNEDHKDKIFVSILHTNHPTADDISAFGHLSLWCENNNIWGPTRPICSD